MDSPTKFDEILRVLVNHGVEFILVGGVAAVLEGVPLSTLDVDVVFLRREDNMPLLLEALLALDARYVDPAGRHILPDAGKLSTMRMHRFRTAFGPLDVMETIGQGLAYADLIGDTQMKEVAGINVRVLGLETIIRSKEQANRDKDRATLHVLRRTLHMKQERGESEG
jgi:predicted nucleotidyltransferase